MIQTPKQLIRVDDRLIHGQVSAGWVPLVDPEYMIIADDYIASSPEDSELFLLAVPYGYEGKIFDVKSAASFLSSLSEDKPFIAVLSTLADAIKLYELGYKFKELNIGGIHYSEGKQEITHYLFTGQKEIDALKKLEELGVRVYLQDLPPNKQYDTEYIYRKWNKLKH